MPVCDIGRTGSAQLVLVQAHGSLLGSSGTQIPKKFKILAIRYGSTDQDTLPRMTVQGALTAGGNEKRFAQFPLSLSGLYLQFDDFCLFHLKLYTYCCLSKIKK
jgi:hypothetical protein